MNSLIDELKYNFRRKDNGLIKIILINVILFICIAIVFVISKISQNLTVSSFIFENLALPSDFSAFIKKPWTIISYFFYHESPFRILFNLLALYWFGNILVEYLGNRRLVNIYLLGGIVGGLIFLLLFNFIPFFLQIETKGLIGASGAVYAVIVAAATLVPDYAFYMIFIGPVKIKYLAFGMILMSVLGSVEANAGGNIAHLGGALMGFLFIKALKGGTDLGKPISKTGEFVSNIFSPKPKMKVTYKGKSNPTGKVIHHDTPDQIEIDAILDKINRSGYESLSKEEKQKLFKASQK